MDVGIPAELTTHDYRVGLTPHGVQLLVRAGHRCYVEKGAGVGAGFTDADYERSGARIAYNHSEVFERAGLVLKVGTPSVEELASAREGQIVAAFWHLPARPREILQTVIEKSISAVAYETVQNNEGHLPILYPLSEMAGRMAPQIAARWLQNDGGGSGLLISGIAGIPPIDVVILGGGTVGINAARAFDGMGARVFVLDTDLEKLQAIEDRFDGRVVTMMAYDFNIARVVEFAHVVVGAVLVPGERAPIVVTREMLRTMRSRSVILDFAIDQGGCIETSRPMTHANPTFLDENIIHYCVPNVTGVVARTATHAFLNGAWKYIESITSNGLEGALQQRPALVRGLAVHQGKVLNPNLALLNNVEKTS